MSDSYELLLRALGLLMSIGGAYWVWGDAQKLKASGASLAPVVWTVLVFFGWIVALPFYLLLRKRLWQKEIAAANGGGAGPPETAQQSPPATPAAAGGNPCSEATIRAMAEGMRQLPRSEAWERMRAHYHDHVCADELGVGRFEEILLQTLDEERP